MTYQPPRRNRVPRFNPGDRVRLVVFDATLGSGDTLATERVALRYAWDGPVPSHSCHADLCEKCAESAAEVVSRRTNGGKIQSLTLIRDRQSTIRERTAS